MDGSFPFLIKRTTMKKKFYKKSLTLGYNMTNIPSMC